MCAYVIPVTRLLRAQSDTPTARVYVYIHSSVEVPSSRMCEFSRAGIGLSLSWLSQIESVDKIAIEPGNAVPKGPSCQHSSS